MIHKVKITDLSDAESYSFNKNDNRYDVWISVVGEEDRKKINRMRRNFNEKNVKHFHQFFADWSDEDGSDWGHLKNEAPQIQHIQNIITFLRPFTQDETPHNIGINCFAGISRSTAIGIVALVMSGRSVDEALNEILKVRAIAWPNIRILDLASTILQIDVKTCVEEWKKRSMDSNEIFIIPDRKQRED